jgi:flagellar hook-associated protein 1 FlgK
MMSTFSGIEVGKKGLQANNTGISTIGHNLSNVETEGYTRQKVNLTASEPIYEPSANRVETPGQIGQGVVVEDIERVRDQAIDDRIMMEKGGLGYWKTKQDFLHQVERIFNDPNSPNIRTALDAYWESWQKVASNPTERAAREELVERTKSLTDLVNHDFVSLNDLRGKADALVQQRVNEVDNMADEIATLNVQIVKSESLGDQPNDLYDKRDLLVDKLSKIVDIRVERTNKHELLVWIGSENLVQGGLVNRLKAVGSPQNEGLSDVVWESSGRLLKYGQGELAGLVSARDHDVKGSIDNLDSLAQNIMDSTNEVHRDGFGLNLKTNRNFFKENRMSPYATGDWDFAGTGNPDGTAVFKVSGSQVLKNDTVAGSSGFMNFGPMKPGDPDVTVAYKTTDTIKDIIDRVNQSDAGVAAYLNQRGQLTLKAKMPEDPRYPEFVIRHVEDSGNLLVGVAGVLNASGAQGAFDWRNRGDAGKFNVPDYNLAMTPRKHPSAWMQIDDAIVSDPDTIAAAGGFDITGDAKPDKINGLGDNRNALTIAELRHKPVMVESQSDFGQFFQSMVGSVGTKSETAKVQMDKDQAVVDSLEGLRKQVSGVNVDEEMTKMLMYQHGYNASARLISTMDSMLQTIIRMGA